MKKIYFFLTLLLSTFFVATASATGESRSNPINVTQAGKVILYGAEETTTDTWLCINETALGENNMIVFAFSGGHYGDVTFYDGNSSTPLETIAIGGENPTTVKKYWDAESTKMYICISQDGPNGSVMLSFATAKQGETHNNAVSARIGSNIVSKNAETVWYKFTANEKKVYTFDVKNCTISNILNADMRISSPANLASAGVAMSAGETVWFNVTDFSAGVSPTIVITAIEIKAGDEPDNAIDATNLSQFIFSVPADPNASENNGAAQTEHYFTYTASKSGFFQWGTTDESWVKGMFGCTVRDVTEGKNLDTPKKETLDNFVIYTIPVIAGHTYLIEQTIGHTKSARDITVFVSFEEATNPGDLPENPIILKLNSKEDLGRVISTTKYFSFTATEAGVYTATVHAGGQVRATTPHDGSWNITRDYSNTELQMHIDDEITLAAGDVLSLQVTLTSDLDIHTNGSDASKPNYYILITKNAGSNVPGVRDGEDIEHAIIGEPDKAYDLYQSSDEDYYDRYYKVVVPANATLYVTTSHDPTIGNPKPINFTLNGKTWNDVKYTTTDIKDSEGKFLGCKYECATSAEERVIYIETDGVSFLYEGATWSYTIDGDVTAIGSIAIDANAEIYSISGTKTSRITKPGLYIVNGKKVAVK